MPDTATLTDRLPAIIDGVTDSLRDLMADYFAEHAETDFPCLNNDLDYSGAVHELIDGAVPIYHAQLDELAYFHHRAALAAITEQFGGDATSGAWPSGPFAAGIYCLIEQGVSEWYAADGEELWDSWVEALESPAIRRAAIRRAAGQPDAATPA
jgi:hypothetical protein